MIAIACPRRCQRSRNSLRSSARSVVTSETEALARGIALPVHAPIAEISDANGHAGDHRVV